MTRVRVLVRPKEGILDPQGQAVERALPALGFEGVANVHVGRMIELDQAADPHVLDALEAERRQRPLDRLALRVEDPLLGSDQNPGPGRH